MLSVVERRLELLKMEGNGFNQSEIVKHLSQKFQCCDRTVYRDFEKREEWQPFLQHLDGQGRLLMKILNRYEQVYRHAGFLLLQASQENAKLGALRLMLDANKQLCETAVIPGLLGRLKLLEEKARRGVFVT